MNLSKKEIEKIVVGVITPALRKNEEINMEKVNFITSSILEAFSGEDADYIKEIFFDVESSWKKEDSIELLYFNKEYKSFEDSLFIVNEFAMDEDEYKEAYCEESPYNLLPDEDPNFFDPYWDVDLRYQDVYITRNNLVYKDDPDSY